MTREKAPSIIILSLRDFLHDRNRAYDEREHRERERQYDEWKKNAITYEEYRKREKEKRVAGEPSNPQVHLESRELSDSTNRIA